MFKFKLPELEKLEIQAVLPIYGEFSIVMSQMRRETSVLLPTPSTSKDQLAGWYSDTAVSWVNTLMNLVFSNFNPHHHTCWRCFQREATTYIFYPWYTRIAKVGGRVQTSQANNWCVPALMGSEFWFEHVHICISYSHFVFSFLRLGNCPQYGDWLYTIDHPLQLAQVLSREGINNY